MAAQIIQTLLLRKTENKIKTTKLAAQMVQALSLRKTERNLKTVKLAAQVVQKLLLKKTKKLMCIQFSLRKMKLQQKRSAFPREMKIHVSSVLFSSLPCQRVRGLNLVIFFFLFDLTYFQANSFIVRLLEP